MLTSGQKPPSRMVKDDGDSSGESLNRLFNYAKAALGDMLLWFVNHVVTNIPSHHLRLLFYRHIMRFKLGAGSSIHLGAYFYARRSLSIGCTSVVNGGCSLDTRGGIVIGNNVSISREAIILTADHDPFHINFAGRCRQVTICDYVFIGTRAMILPGVRLGEGCVIGAGSVVTHDIAPYTIVAGVPGRKIGERPKGLDYSAAYRRLWH